MNYKNPSFFCEWCRFFKVEYTRDNVEAVYLNEISSPKIEVLILEGAIVISQFKYQSFPGLKHLEVKDCCLLDANIFMECFS